MRAPGTADRPARILVTGGAGFIGSNLSNRLLAEGHHVTVYDALSRPGVARNLDWLTSRYGDAVTAIVADIRDAEALGRAAATADAVFHFAAQVAVTTSMVEPLEDFEINVRSTVTLLDALRRRGTPVPLVFASTNKVYGDLADVALVPDQRRLCPGRSGAARRRRRDRGGSISTRPMAAPRGRPTNMCSTMPGASACRRPCCG